MLRPPHTRYQRLFVYHFDRLVPAPEHDADFIGAWQEDDCTILFFHASRDAAMEELAAAQGAALVYQADLDHADWEAGARVEGFTTRLLRVHPLWEEPPPGEGLPICLDPSVIFGSGFHPSTRLCLEALENLVPEPEARVRSVLDLGTGTGILAIAAARLGAREVEAVDINPLSVEVARANVERNACQDLVRVRRADLTRDLPATDRDLVIANLHKDLLLQLFEDADFWRARFHVISGFLPGMEGELLAALPMERLRMLDRRGRERWRLWVLENREPGGVPA